MDRRLRFLGAFLWAAAAHAAPSVHVWPTDPAPCDAASSLQACIDSAAEGDEVQIATDGPIPESLSVQQSLTLRAATGFEPRFSEGGGVAATFVGLSLDTQSIDIEGLRDLAYVAIDAGSGARMAARVVGDGIKPPSSSGGAALALVADSGAGPCTFELSGNAIDVPAGDGGIELVESAGTMHGLVADNAIAMEGGGTAISLDQSTGFSTVDVIANQILGSSFDGGILVQQSGGVATVRILDNLVVGAAGFAPTGAVALGSSAGLLSTRVANNTLVAGAVGISATRTPSGSVGGRVANNIVVGNILLGMNLDPTVAATLMNDHNLVFANGSNVYKAGAGTVTADPLFVDPHGDYHLAVGSPAIDAGSNGAVPADLTTDLDGTPRNPGNPQGPWAWRPHVDIGAYETAPEPEGALGPAIGVAALGVLARGRRRAARC